MRRLPRTADVESAPLPVAHYIDASPVLDVVDSLRTTCRMLVDVAPTSDVLVALTKVEQQIRAAIVAGASMQSWVSVAEAAQREGVSRSAITARCRAGTMRCRKDGRAYKIAAAPLQVG